MIYIYIYTYIFDIYIYDIYMIYIYMIYVSNVEHVCIHRTCLSFWFSFVGTGKQLGVGFFFCASCQGVGLKPR